MKKLGIVIVGFIIVGLLYWQFVYVPQQLRSNSSTEYISYKSSEYSPAFRYPASWGEVHIQKGPSTCPQEDTYRTADTLNVFDWEYSFPKVVLPESSSTIQMGIRMYGLEADHPNECGDDFLLHILQKKVVPETLSSFRLMSITNSQGLWGTYNPSASRLNTEARSQYTFFIPQVSRTYILQSYFSFVPHFDSPELVELEQKFDGDIVRYIEQGATAQIIRQHLKDFHAMAQSVQFTEE